MTYNNGRQTFSNYDVPAGASYEVPFTTVTTTVTLKDSDGGSLGSAGSVRYHQVGWQDFGTSNTALELLPGDYTFEMTYNNGRQLSQIILSPQMLHMKWLLSQRQQHFDSHHVQILDMMEVSVVSTRLAGRLTVQLLAGMSSRNFCPETIPSK